MSVDLQEGSFAALIFDCDGTLVETLPAHVAALKSVLEPFGLRPSVEWARTKYGQSPATVLAALDAEVGHIPVPHDEILRAWGESYGRNLHLLEELKAVCDIARMWQGRVPMAVASNGYRRSINATLGAVGLSSLFQHVVSIEDVVHGKPAPDLFLEAARQMGVAPELCVVFEDSEEGLEAARSAGMRTIFAPEVGHPEVQP
jgi:beta-phosphoglucomutase-like phosphatase (HAD superfamily)